MDRTGLIDSEPQKPGSVSGILPVYKLTGCTSFDVVSYIRRVFGTRKVGHAGTLDPAVEGVLPVCIGQATRLVDALHQFPKVYEGIMVLGVATDTLDQEGRVIKEVEVGDLSRIEIESAFAHFTGTYEQLPPMYSAVKIQGKKLYEWARSGQEVPRKPRPVTIYEFKLLEVEAVGKKLRLFFRVKCSKGTYIRSLCADVGAFLGFPAHLCLLKRVQSGPFSLQESVSFSEIEAAKREGRLMQLLYPPDVALSMLPPLYLDDKRAAVIGHGQQVTLSMENDAHPNYPKWTLSSSRTYRVYRVDGQFIAVCKGWQEGNLFVVKPEKVFFSP